MLTRLQVLMISSVSLSYACGTSGYVLRPVARIVADDVGRPVSTLEEIFGTPRKVDSSTNKQVYVWFLPTAPAGAPTGLHGCEMEVTVDARSGLILGYSLSNIGWSTCTQVERKIRIAAR